MSIEYTPRAGSLAEQVISYFRLHPNDSMTLDDIVETFRPSGTKGNVQLALEKAIDAGLLIWRGGLVSAGPELDAQRQPEAPAVAPWPSYASMSAAAAAVAAAAVSKGTPRAGIKRGHLPAIDLQAAQIEYDVPVPVGFSTRQRESRWTALLNKLDKPGASTTIPREYNGSLSGWIRKLKKSNPEDKRTFRVGLDMRGVNRVWRTA